jgi:phosphoribosylformylglycinamidine (FGAM) synthase-like enzyme
LEEAGPAEAAAFNERGARAVVSVTPSKLAAVLDTARQYKVAAHQIGQVTRGDAFRIQYKGRAVIDSSVETLRDAWAHSLERTLTAK